MPHALNFCSDNEISLLAFISVLFNQKVLSNQKVTISSLSVTYDTIHRSIPLLRLSAFASTIPRMSEEDSPLPSPSKTAAAAAAASAVEADLTIVVPSLGPDATLEERQLAEFNNWLKRYNNYQHQMEAYWRGRLQIEASERGDGNAVTKGKEESFVTSFSKKGSINKNKWLTRYEELVSLHTHTPVD